MRTTRPESTLNTIWFLLIRIIGWVALGYFLWRVRSVLVTIILAVMLTYVLLPAVEFLCSKRILMLSKRATRLLATILVFLAFFFIVGLSVKVLIKPFEQEAKGFGQQWDTYAGTARQTIQSVTDWYKNNVPDDLRKFLGKQDFKDIGTGMTGFAGRIAESTRSWLKNIVGLVMIPVLAFYFVLDSRSLKREMMALVPPRRVRETIRIMRDVSGILQSYVVGQIILCVLAGVVTWIVLHFTGMKYVLVLAVLAGITRAIPVIGPVASGIPICILGALQSPALGAWLLVFVTVMHFAESKFIMPILIGDRMKLHPAVVLISLLIGAEFFGLLGMFLAAPVGAIIRELINRYVVRPRYQKRVRPNGSKASTSTLVRSEHL
jgi:predicted PurR-regulated permease PerM